jgi:hypothetical protein
MLPPLGHPGEGSTDDFGKMPTESTLFGEEPAAATITDRGAFTVLPWAPEVDRPTEEQRPFQ